MLKIKLLLISMLFNVLNLDCMFKTHKTVPIGPITTKVPKEDYPQVAAALQTMEKRIANLEAGTVAVTIPKDLGSSHESIRVFQNDASALSKLLKDYSKQKEEYKNLSEINTICTATTVTCLGLFIWAGVKQLYN